MEVRSIGIDASLTGTGVCTLVDGVFKTHFLPAKDLKGAARLFYLNEKLFRIIGYFKPTVAVLEGYSYNSVGRVFEIGEWGGVIKLGLYRREIKTLIVAPLSLKKFIGVKNIKNKQSVIGNVKKQYKLDVGDNDNLADAAVLAKIGYVSSTGDSTRRAELEVVRELKLNKKLKGAGNAWRFTKLQDSV